MTLKKDMSELSSRAKAFSVDALIGNKRSHESDEVDSANAKLRRALRVELCSRDLWRKFHSLGTEMIITKAGRRMFPTVKVRLTGLDPSASYIVFLDIVPVDDKRYRYVYHSSQWMVAGSGDPPLPPVVYVHPDSPASGQLWMAQGVVAFDKLKLTNNRKPLVRGQVSLHSMHKYQPRVHILETTDLDTPAEQQAKVEKALTYTFPETAFTTVTAYQNQQITRLKIASNPFAKGFREASRTRDGSEEPRSLRPPGEFISLLPAPSVPFDPWSTSMLFPPSRSFYGCQPITTPVRFVVPPTNTNISHDDTSINGKTIIPSDKYLSESVCRQNNVVPVTTTKGVSENMKIAPLNLSKFK